MIEDNPPAPREKNGSQGKKQVAALTWRLHAGELQVLLITSRDTGRWVIPKGGKMGNHTRAQSAAIEAFEEAGVRGVIKKKSIGSYTYLKTSDRGPPTPYEVRVYPLAVTRQVKKFKERGQRKLEWMAKERAAELVAEPELAAIIRGFVPPVT